MQTDDARIPEDEKQVLTSREQFAAQQEAEDMETIRVRGPQRPGDERRLADYDARRAGTFSGTSPTEAEDQAVRRRLQEDAERAEADERARHDAALAQDAEAAQAAEAESHARVQADAAEAGQ